MEHLPTPKVVLTGTLKLLDKPKRWTQRANARTSPDGGGLTAATDAAATCWCLGGAIYKVAADLMPTANVRVRSLVMMDASEALFPDADDPAETLVNWNDSPDRTYSEVRDLLVSTIERL